MHDVRPTAVLGALLLAGGLVLGGWLIGRGFEAARVADRVVTVKGVAEQEVAADLALWPIRFVVTSNRLEEAQAKIEAASQAVRAFLVGQGLPPEAIAVRRLEVSDLLAQAYRSGPVDSRYIVGETLTVRTTDIAKVEAASQGIGALIAAGVVLDGGQGESGGGPIYLFTRLNTVKPTMIAAATENARVAAQQFAKDSGSRITGIRRANQGLFQILPRDEAPGLSEARQIAKVVRVVTTIDYQLAD